MDATDVTDTTQDSTEQAPDASVEVVQPTPEPGVPKAEVAKLLSDMKAEHGRALKSLQEQSDSRQGEIEQSKTRFETAEAQLSEAEDQLAKGDGEVADVMKWRKELRVAKAEVERDRTKLDQSRKEHDGEVQSARKTTRDMKILKVVADKSVDLGKLQNIIGDSEDFDYIGRVADILAESAPVEQPAHVDSGKTTGGGKDLSGMSPHDLTVAAYSKTK